MIRVEGLSIAFPGFSLDHIHLHVRAGEAFALLGPTGAGKTLLLEAIVGVVPVAAGRILIGGRDVTRLAPEQRRIGIVYQDHALFPHLTVEENIVYGQRYCDASLPSLTPLIERLGLRHLLARRIHALSGGEKQRVALARALAVAPSVLLLDEPLSALDPNFREDIRGVLKTLHQDTGITLLMVTHDFAEAHFLAQRTAIMNSGCIAQIGALESVFAHPETRFVAEFVGIKNLFSAEISGDTARIGPVRLQCRSRGNGFRSVAIRSENVTVSRQAKGAPSANQLAGRLRRVLNRGYYADVWVDVDGVPFHAISHRRDFFRSDVVEGEPVCLAIAPEDIHLLRDATGSKPAAGRLDGRHTVLRADKPAARGSNW